MRAIKHDGPFWTITGNSVPVVESHKKSSLLWIMLMGEVLLIGVKSPVQGFISGSRTMASHRVFRFSVIIVTTLNLGMEDAHTK